MCSEQNQKVGTLRPWIFFLKKQIIADFGALFEDLGRFVHTVLRLRPTSLASAPCASVPASSITS
jgi:hypothetical protein